MPPSERYSSIVWMILLVLLSAYFSATETAFSSFNRLRLKSRADEGDRRAALVLRISEKYDRMLSAILVGNNLVNIALTTVATLFFVRLYGQSVGAGVATAVSTVTVLIFGEISPKTLAKEHADGFALATAPILRGIMILLSPVNWLFSLWKKLLSLLFRSAQKPAVTEAELLTIVTEAEQGGSLSEQEGELIRRTISFHDRQAVDILIPRVDMEAVDADATPQQLGEAFAHSGYSRLPVYEDTVDHIVGIVHQKDQSLRRDATPRELMKPAVFVPPTVKIQHLLRQLQQEKSHLAIVSDEYGGTLGLVTMEDILEELVGEIWDEHDDVVEAIRENGDGTVSVRCTTELAQMMAYFDRETACDAATVSGWVMEALGRIPAPGDTFTADGLSVTVTETDQNRPEEITVSPLPEEE